MVGICALSFLFLTGCEQSETISEYTVPKHETLQSSEFLAEYERTHPKPERMIGLVIPRSSLLWFFKLQGNMDAIAARESELREFFKGLKFGPADDLQWTLPEGWRQQPGNEMRHATILLSGEPPIEMSVTKFASRQDLPVTDQVVMNINRWRGQLSLPPIESEDLDQQAEKLPVGDGVAYWLNIVGRPQPKPASMSLPPAQTARNQPAATEGGADKPSLPFDKPEGWTEGPPAAFAVVSLQVADGEQKASVTVTRAGGNPLLNVNRWRGQVGLGPLTEEELAQSARQVSVGGLKGSLYEMTEGDRSIFGVIVEEQGQMWFIKLMGDAPLVERERIRFEEFLKSLNLKSGS
ncbi:hypothetical protein [Schlesneria sp. T3-172]|uniref:hypothetical protein n=1 Tax=Schlesneria sphaerica TaxID=3373610 RepID=UPI002EE8F575